MLFPQVPVKKTVVRTFSISLNVDAGSFVIWSFKTKAHDIGFQVDFDDRNISMYQRYNSHVQCIKGFFNVPENGGLKLIWDNSYSLMRSKVLSYVVKVLTRTEYEAARELADEVAKDRQKYIQQRTLIKRTLREKAKDVLFSTGHGANTAIQFAAGAEEFRLMRPVSTTKWPS
jgi:hypothetical protein